MKTLFLPLIFSFILIFPGRVNAEVQVDFTPSTFNETELNERDRFLKYDLPEAKDICKQFLTLVVGVLVFTLTFSEKIVNFSTANRLVKAVLIASYIFFIFSIILCGLGLVELLMSAGKAVYFDITYRRNESWAIYLMLSSGLTFLLGLISLIIDAIMMLVQKKPSLT